MKETIDHLASKKKTKGIPGKIVSGTISTAARTVGVTAGALSGLASGDVSKAVANAVVFEGTAKKLARGANKITNATVNRFGGAVMRVKAEHGGYKKQMKKAGVDIDKLYGQEKDKAVLKALGQYTSAQRRGGDALGNAKWARAVNVKLTERESRDKTKQ